MLKITNAFKNCSLLVHDNALTNVNELNFILKCHQPKIYFHIVLCHDDIYPLKV